MNEKQEKIIEDWCKKELEKFALIDKVTNEKQDALVLKFQACTPLYYFQDNNNFKEDKMNWDYKMNSVNKE